MLALLLGGGVVYLVLGDLQEAVILLAFASMSVLITVVQEARTERVLEALRDLTSPRALVIRDGERKRIAGREVVRGDLVVLAEGDRVPADAALVDSHDLQTDESLLTGESVPVRKVPRSEDAPTAGLRPGGDDLPYVFSGSLVVSGTGIGEVIAIGALSEIGKIGQSLNTLELEPPRLQTQTRRLVRVFAMVGAAVSVLAVLLYGTSERWMARRAAGRHCARHVDAARRVSSRTDGLHGDGRLAHLAGARTHSTRRRDRNAGLCHGVVHGQDGDAHREPNDDRRAAARERRSLSAS